MVSRSPVLCPVFCGSVLPCGAMVWCPAVRFALFCGRCGAVLLLGAVCGTLCCSLFCCVLCPRRVALCRAPPPFGRCLVPGVAARVCRWVWLPGFAFWSACRPWCPCPAPGRPPCCLACWCGALRCPAPCAESGGAVLPCGAVPSGCVVRLSSFPLQKSPAVSPLLGKRSENHKIKKFKCFPLEN